MARHQSSGQRPKRGPVKARRRRATNEQAAAIDYRNPQSLFPFLTSRGKIKARAQTGLSRRDQSKLAREVKRARELALLPYVIEETGHGSREPRARRREA